MTPQRPQTFDRRIGQRHGLVDHVVWEPQVPRSLFRRRPWEQATVVEVSASGALIEAHTNRAICEGTKIAISLGPDRGLVAVRCIDSAPNPEMAFYGVQFLWLDRDLKARFADSVSITEPGGTAWQSSSATERAPSNDVISLR